MSPLAQLITELRGARGKDAALTAELLAVRMTSAGHRMDSRAVRRFITLHADEIADALRPAVLLAEPPDGFWLATDLAELEARARTLARLEWAAVCKTVTFLRHCAAAGFRNIGRAAGGPPAFEHQPTNQPTND